MAASGKRFIIDRQSDPVDFLSWLINTLHLDLTGGKRKKRSGEPPAPAGRPLCASTGLLPAAAPSRQRCAHGMRMHGAWAVPARANGRYWMSCCCTAH